MNKIFLTAIILFSLPFGVSAAESVSGTLSGLGAGKSVTLLLTQTGTNPGSCTNTFTENGPILLDCEPLGSPATYYVTVATQTLGQICTVTNGSGSTLPTNVIVTCAVAPPPAASPIPTLSEWAQIVMMLAMIATAGFYGWRMKQR